MPCSRSVAEHGVFRTLGSTEQTRLEPDRRADRLAASADLAAETAPVAKVEPSECVWVWLPMACPSSCARLISSG